MKEWVSRAPIISSIFFWTFDAAGQIAMLSDKQVLVMTTFLVVMLYHFGRSLIDCQLL